MNTGRYRFPEILIEVRAAFLELALRKNGLENSGVEWVITVWDAFAECNFWFRTLNWTPLIF
jgi:hypothetical protein